MYQRSDTGGNQSPNLQAVTDIVNLGPDPRASLDGRSLDPQLLRGDPKHFEANKENMPANQKFDELNGFSNG